MPVVFSWVRSSSSSKPVETSSFTNFSDVSPVLIASFSICLNADTLLSENAAKLSGSPLTVSISVPSRPIFDSNVAFLDCMVSAIGGSTVSLLFVVGKCVFSALDGGKCGTAARMLLYLSQALMGELLPNKGIGSLELEVFVRRNLSCAWDLGNVVLAPCFQKPLITFVGQVVIVYLHYIYNREIYIIIILCLTSQYKQKEVNLNTRYTLFRTQRRETTNTIMQVGTLATHHILGEWCCALARIEANRQFC